ncbi:MAG: VOC family protein [Microbacteriaceae bacterium]|nr:VOC family protein [Cryobacterium sp.]MCC6377039.1 VOC family protein [Microbacteriaceae bacterium]
MPDYTVRMIVLSTENLDESIDFYTKTFGFPLKFRDGNHFAQLDGGAITIALATEIDHPNPGNVALSIKTDDVDAAAKQVDENGGGILRAAYNDAHERRAVVFDNMGNTIVFYKPNPR